MPRDWSRESWHKVFPREDGVWLAMSWQARGLYRLLQSEASRDGVIRLGKFSGASGFRWVAVVFRMPDDEAQAACDELEADGFIVVQPDGSWLLPHHADQQATSTTSAERVKRHREKHRVTNVTGVAVTPETPETQHVTDVTLQALQVTQAAVTGNESPVTVKRKEREERGDKKDEKATRARTREAAAAPVDPKVRRIALELAAHKKFASLDHPVVAEELLGSLGSLALGLVEERIADAVAVAAAEAESGANERRLRQVLSWKLKDAASGKTSKKPTHAVGKDGVPLVQGTGPDHEGEIERLLERIDRHNAEDEKKREEYRRANGLTEEVPF